MRIFRYGITLARLTAERIEMVRQWRNAPQIRDFMEYRETITPEMQQKWFHSLDPLRDFYFVIEYHAEPIGLIHTSNIDWNEKTGHSGLFIRKDELLGTHIPVLASLSMVDFFFSYCTLETLYAKVMESNPVAINYNARLGFKPVEPAGEKLFRHYALTKHAYFTTTPSLHTMTKAMHDEACIVEMGRPLYDELLALEAIRPDYASNVTRIVDAD